MYLYHIFAGYRVFANTIVLSQTDMRMVSIIYVIVCESCLCDIRSDAPSFAYLTLDDIVRHRLFLYYLAHKIHYLLATPFPVMRRVIAPVVYPRRNVLVFQ